MVVSETSSCVKAPQCLQCSKTYTRHYRLNEHLRMENSVEETDWCKWFECPFCCGKVHCRTVVALLSHCEREHKENLGKDYTPTLNNWITCMVLVAQTTFNRKRQYTIARLYTVPFTPLQSLYTALESTKEPCYTKRTSKNVAVSHNVPILYYM